MNTQAEEDNRLDNLLDNVKDLLPEGMSFLCYAYKPGIRDFDFWRYEEVKAFECKIKVRDLLRFTPEELASEMEKLIRENTKDIQ
jgi:hypothetical protein